MTENPKRPPPFNLTIYKGQKNVILSRTFAKWAFNLSHLINTVLISFTLRLHYILVIKYLVFGNSCELPFVILQYWSRYLILSDCDQNLTYVS